MDNGLAVLFYNTCKVNLDVNENGNITNREGTIYSIKAVISKRSQLNCVTKFIILYQVQRNLHKN